MRPEPDEDLAPRTGVVDLGSVESRSIATLVQRVGRLGDEGMLQICCASEIAGACQN